MIYLKRAYDKPSKGYGIRILVDRLWPRGLKRTDATIDVWMKEIAPSVALRKWFGHDANLWSEFKKRYERELELPEREFDIARIREYMDKDDVTLIFAAKDEVRNNAVVLREFLERRSIKT